MIAAICRSNASVDTVPRLVKKILARSVREDVRHWSRLNSAGSGSDRKLRFAIRQARDVGAAGVVATVDRDRDRRT